MQRNNFSKAEWCKAGYLNFGTINILGLIILCCEWLLYALWMFNSISGHYPLVAIGTNTVMTTKSISIHCHCGSQVLGLWGGNLMFLFLIFKNENNNSYFIGLL